VDDDMVVRIEP